MMTFVDRIRGLAKRIPDLVPHLHTEEATKTALVLPFIAAMGYDVFDPTEVVPEFVADVGIKKGEKVDYVIKRDGEIVMLVECKSVGAKLALEHASQLYRYFSVTKARIALLTTGVVYQFFSDLDEPNKLDARPFLIVDMAQLREESIVEISKMTKQAFSLDEMLLTANHLKYQREIRGVLEQQLESPDEDLVRLIHGRVGTGRFSQAAREQFSPLVRKAFAQLVADRVGDRLRGALAQEGLPAVSINGPPAAAPVDSAGVAPPDSDVATTDEELDGFRVVRAIVCGMLAPERVVNRDAKSYFAVLVDDNNRKPLCRLWFNGSQKYLGLLDDAKKETRYPITSVVDIYRYADDLRITAARYA